MMVLMRSSRRRSRHSTGSSCALRASRSGSTARITTNADEWVMFTGIVSGLGEVIDVEEKAEGLRRIRIGCDDDPDSFAIGASIACSGICLTVVERGVASNRGSFAVDAAAETLRLT